MRYALIKDNIVINVVEADKTFIDCLVQSGKCDSGVVSNTLNIGDTFSFSLELSRQTKLNELNASRYKALQASTFTSDALLAGQILTYKNDIEAQGFFKDIKTVLDLVTDTFTQSWYTIEQGWKPHSKPQLLQLVIKSFLAVSAIQNKFSTLDQQRLDAKSIEDLNKVVWS